MSKHYHKIKLSKKRKCPEQQVQVIVRENWEFNREKGDVRKTKRSSWGKLGWNLIPESLLSHQLVRAEDEKNMYKIS